MRPGGSNLLRSSKEFEPPYVGSCLLKKLLKQALGGEPKGAVLLHHAGRVGAGWNLGEAETLEVDLVQTREQLAIRVFLLIQVRHVNGEDLILEQIEIVIPALARQVGSIGIPARAHARMVSHVEYLLDVRRERGAGAMDLQPDHLAVVAGEAA